MILIIITFDIFSYVIGTKYGSTKILKTIESKKTLEGLVGGIIFSLLFSISLIILFKNEINLPIILFILIIIFSSFTGDIIESYFKRINNLKNSSNFLPGHWWFFDRFDSLIFSMIHIQFSQIFYYEYKYYGSTGVIVKKTLKLISKFFPNIKINLLVANKNYKTLINQIKFFKPRYVYLNDHSKIKFIKEIVKYYKIKILDSDELNYYLKNYEFDLSILAISGYQSLNFLDQIVKNTDNLGILSKEAIVSAGHLFKKIITLKKQIFSFRL